jgi:hypothetical protein
MPIHDWTRVDAGILHHFHQRWIVAITEVLNERLLPGEYYALTEQQGAGFEPDIGRHVAVPLEETYGLAIGSVPARWRRLLEMA